jgi:hypothetical protein
MNKETWDGREGMVEEGEMGGAEKVRKTKWDGRGKKRRGGRDCKNRGRGGRGGTRRGGAWEGQE